MSCITGRCYIFFVFWLFGFIYHLHISCRRVDIFNYDEFFTTGNFLHSESNVWIRACLMNMCWSSELRIHLPHYFTNEMITTSRLLHRTGKNTKGKHYKMGLELNWAGYSRWNVLFAVNTQTCNRETKIKIQRRAFSPSYKNSTRIHAMLRGYHYWRWKRSDNECILTKTTNQQ